MDQRMNAFIVNRNVINHIIIIIIIIIIYWVDAAIRFHISISLYLGSLPSLMGSQKGEWNSNSPAMICLKRSSSPSSEKKGGYPPSMI